MKKFLLSLLLFGFAAKAEFVVPATPHPVNDYAKVLTLDEKEVVAEKLVTLKKETGVQLGILIVDTLDGTPIEVAAIKVAEAWKLGSKTNDGGILLMLSIKDRKSRLEIGRGLEGFLTDANSKEILYAMRPYLKSSSYAAALNFAVDGIKATVINNKTEIMTKPVGASNDSSHFVFYLVFGVLGLVCFVMYYNYRSEQKRLKAEEEARKKRDADGSSNAKAWARLMSSSNSGGGVPTRPTKSTSSSGSRNTTVVAPVYIDNSSHYDSGSSHSDYSSSSSSSDYSSSSSDFSGGGGDFGGGGSSDSW